MYAKYFKRVIDFSLSLIALIVLSPLLLVLIVTGTVFMKGNPFFTQERPGKDEKIFKLIKFRTMDNRKNREGKLLPDEVRLNKYGRFLRATSLDELPQLFNILKGDMSIVGPRPALWNQFDLIDLRDKNSSNSVRPGLTEWAQVNGRDELPIDVKAGFDGEYIKKMSIVFDIKIILMTVVSVFTSKGVREGRNESSNNR